MTQDIYYEVSLLLHYLLVTTDYISGLSWMLDVFSGSLIICSDPQVGSRLHRDRGGLTRNLCVIEVKAGGWSCEGGRSVCVDTQNKRLLSC